MDTHETMKMLKMNPGAKTKTRTPILPESEDYSDWSQLAELILEAEIKDEIATGIKQQQVILEAQKKGTQSEIILPAPISSNMQALAMRVATGLDELLSIRDSIDADFWLKKKMERVVRLEQVRNRLSNYAELELIAIQKLQEQVENGKVTAPGELLAIAHAGARVSQLQTMREENMVQKPGNPMMNMDVNLQINQISGVSPQGDLPGPGHLGPIQLRLSHRVRSQLESAIPERKNDESFLDSIEMLTAKEVQKELLRDGAENGGPIIDVEGDS